MTTDTPLRIIFAGTPAFALPALRLLLQSHHQVIAVLTQPDRPAGRGRRLTASPIKQCAQAAGIEVLQPTTLRDAEIEQQLTGLDADLMVVAAYGLILPPAVLDLFAGRVGCWNIHASLLPRWRGAAPIQRAILAGDEQTGVCIMQMAAGLDTGPVLKQQATPIGASETAGQLHDRLAELGAKLLLDSIATRDQLIAKPQPEQGVSYADKLSKREATLDLSRDAAALARQVRAFDPWPVAQLPIGEQRLRVWRAEALAGSAPVGLIRRADAAGIELGTGDGILRLTEVQKPGGRRMAVADFLNAQPLPVGRKLDELEATN